MNRKVIDRVMLNYVDLRMTVWISTMYANVPRRYKSSHVTVELSIGTELLRCGLVGNGRLYEYMVISLGSGFVQLRTKLASRSNSLSLVEYIRLVEQAFTSSGLSSSCATFDMRQVFCAFHMSQFHQAPFSVNL